MNERAKHIGLMILGWSFLLLGIAGLVLPFLQGILFIMIGLIILSRVHPWARRLVDRLRQRFPTIDRGCGFAEEKLTEWRRKLPWR